MDVGCGVGVVKTCGCRLWGGCGKNTHVDVGCGVGVVEKMWMCGCRQWGGCCGENVDVWM